MNKLSASTLLLILITTSLCLAAATPHDQVPIPADCPAAQAIIIDHTCTDISQIPEHWILQARVLVIHYAHTSHGSQINSGLQNLEGLDPRFDYSIFYAGSSPPTALDCEAGTLCMYDGNPPETYIAPEDYWQTEDGRTRTRAVIDSGLFGFSMWSWCGQQSSNPTETVQLYLDTMVGWEQEYAGKRFILMTGHTDGGTTTLERNNDMVRQYARDHGMVLFDFADIETYAPDGSGPYDNNSEGTCTWCEDWCTDHPADCVDLPGSCAHSSSLPDAQLFCRLKGNAFWWMMARLAGWDGTLANVPTKTASTDTAVHGQQIDYTIVVQGFVPTATLHLTDTVPAGLAYLPGSLTATAGQVDDSAAPTLLWSGQLDPSAAITVSYAVSVSSNTTQRITNMANIATAGQSPLSCAAEILVNPQRIFLPMLVLGNPW